MIAAALVAASHESITVLDGQGAPTDGLGLVRDSAGTVPPGLAHGVRPRAKRYMPGPTA